MTKSPGFWFFVGDWMKDAELRFCSIFARGLLVDLLCILFEAKEQGYASNPNGEPRSNEQIVDAISGSTREEKLAALAELERNGVLSRDSRGVLYSRRIARIGEISKTRSKAGSKRGSKTEAKSKQNDQQKAGVTVSDSVSVSDTDITTYTHSENEKQIGVPDRPYLNNLPSDLIKAWNEYLRYKASDGADLNEMTAELQMLELRQAYPKVEDQIAALNFAILRGWAKFRTAYEHNRDKETTKNKASPQRATNRNAELMDRVLEKIKAKNGTTTSG